MSAVSGGSDTTERPPINPVLMDPEGHWHPELERRVAEAIRRYPNVDAEWWIGASAALFVVDEWLRSGGAS